MIGVGVENIIEMVDTQDGTGETHDMMTDVLNVDLKLTGQEIVIKGKIQTTKSHD